MDADVACSPWCFLVQHPDQFFDFKSVMFAGTDDQSIHSIVGNDFNGRRCGRRCRRSSRGRGARGLKQGSQGFCNHGGCRVFQRDQGDLLADSHHVNGADNAQQPLNIGLHVRDDEHARRRIGYHDAAFGYKRGEKLF